MIAPGFARARFTPALTPALANTTVLPAAWRAVRSRAAAVPVPEPFPPWFWSAPRTLDQCYVRFSSI